MAKGKTEKNKKMNPLLWFLFAIVIPVSVVIALVLIILNIAGFDTINWLKDRGDNIPVVSDMVTTEEEAEIESKEMQLQEKIDAKEQEIDELTQSLNDQEVMIQDLEREVIRLEKSQESTVSESTNEEEATDILKTLAKSYEEMDPEKAALILQSMSDQATSVSILEKLSNESRGEILQEMDPEIAADLTEKLMIN